MKNVLSFICLATIRAISLAAKADTDRPVDIPPALRCLLNTSGTVYSVNAARKTSSTSNTPKVEVVVTKTGGKAKTEVTISSVSTITAGTLTTVKKRYTTPLKPVIIPAPKSLRFGASKDYRSRSDWKKILQ